MVQYLQQLKVWADANAKDVRSDKIKLWSLKTPAIVAAASSGMIAALHWPSLVSAAAGFISGICVSLDGIMRPGAMLNTHKRAVHDLGILSNWITQEWDIGIFEQRNPNKLAGSILRAAQERWLEIAAYLEGVETGESPNHARPRSTGSRH